MTIKTKVTGLDHQGRGLSHINGKVVFIPNSLPDEEVEIQIIQDKKNYSLGKVTKSLSTSSKRVKPDCPYYGACGGCHLSHMNYESQIDFKLETIKSIIKKYAKLEIEPEVIKANHEYNYRNKISLKIKDYKWGYYQDNTHDFIHIEKCLLAKESINNIIKNSKLFKIKNGEITIRANYNDEIIISILTESKINLDINEFAKDNKIVGIIINDKIYYGEDKFIEIINNNLYQVSYNSFFQINNETLSKVLEILNQRKYNNVLDLYCGVGTLGIPISKKKLYGIEISASAIKNALVNNKMNKQDNLYILGDSSKIKDIDDKIDTIIIDPPRSGVSKQTMEHLLEKKSGEIIYMSCDPMTLARDLNILQENYKLDKIYLVDMFPQTYHIECIALLSRKINES